ncbi:bifunctional MaoC family dehydratase N-terminal/OB-fold nucleic acid binding domain-containing protein [Nocardioides terrisoli]|uniref:bifunctional MaoC family dehydratase N-terminal/OB-fold nucleic acid binding domain-containing protein n=1 Tax=Nocardioides terrisoli TaxID=3388267 RepID=UPI00287BC12C|nr:bifunctional MaoC family dehydratase N-terminal/OB-fold nucleic acid binding domain-containing protein [Nocardioides marmorisolisilvae]
MNDHDWIMARVAELRALGDSEPKPGRDPVNQPMINNWLEAIGEADPRYTAGEAPPGMAQVWTMDGLDHRRRAASPLHATMRVFDEAGYTSVLGTNCEQTYLRPLRVGEQVTLSARLDSVVGPKRTGVGEGYFITTQNTWRVGDEVVATMLFRVLKFKPGTRAAAVDRTQLVRPQMNRDTEFFWKGTAVGELRIQKCGACGALRHPPGPMCPRCHASDRSHVVASGRGTVFSFLVHHAPRLPGKQLPVTLALVDLEEGVRMIGEVRGAPESIAIGDPVRVAFERIDDDLTLAQWEVAPR